MQRAAQAALVVLQQVAQSRETAEHAALHRPERQTQALGELAARDGGIGDDGDVGLEALHLLGRDVDTNELRPGRRPPLVAHGVAPAYVGHLEPAADAEQNIDVVPELARRDGRDPERDHGDTQQKRLAALERRLQLFEHRLSFRSDRRRSLT